MLIHLLSDVARYPSVQRKFQESPNEVLDEYGVSPEARTALRDRDTCAINTHIQSELQSLQEKATANEKVMWPPPVEPTINQVKPSTGKINTVIAVVATGHNFTDSPQASFELGGTVVEVEHVQVVQKDQLDVLTGTATFKETGSYSFVIKTVQGQAKQLNAFTATE